MKFIPYAAESWDQVLPLLFYSRLLPIKSWVFNAEIVVFYVQLLGGFEPVGEPYVEGAVYCRVLYESGVSFTVIGL